MSSEPQNETHKKLTTDKDIEHESGVKVINVKNKNSTIGIDNTTLKESHESTPTHIVGIGASAGGLEALQVFFKYLPVNTGAAFIVVQHLSPDFKSMMPELLSKHTTIPIYQVSDGDSIEANSIYLMPPRKKMLVREGKLLFSEQMPDTSLHMPIDAFLRSLAKEAQHRAIGIVLSGTGSDGTRGIKSIKESGGLLIVQEPGSAKFDGMPISAYNTGLADFLLSPEEMGPSLEKFIKHPSISGENPALKSSINENILSQIFHMLKRQSSINFSQYKASTVARRIERRLGINQLTNLDDYLSLLQTSSRELQILGKELLIGVTRFFRDRESFERLTDDVVPKIVNRAKSQKDSVRLWVAGCSTGEEAYSLAMLFNDYIEKTHSNCQIKIFATDVDEEAITEASTGIYSVDIEQDISAERLGKYFIKQDNSYIVTQKLRQMVIFATHNMIEDPPFSNMDFVSCRNALIYFQHAAQKKVISSFYFALKKNGFMFLGSSESLGDLQSHFETISDRAKIFVKISNMRVPIGSSPLLREKTHLNYSGVAMSPVSSIQSPICSSKRGHLDRVLDRLVHEYAPDCIVLNEAFEAVHVYGDVSLYTKGVIAGKISNNIKDMVLDDLSVATSTALFRCKKNEEDIFYQDVVINTSEENRIYVDLSIFLVKGGDSATAPHFYIIQFIRQEKHSNAGKNRPKISFDATEQSRQRIYDLEQELLKKQEHLQVTVEELETTNEELQSANEELMSANEELHSTNEELQSVNEELYTVNSEYQEKIAELTEANDDLDSVITATDIGIIFLDEQLTIRKFTPPTTRYVNLRTTDLGRPFHHISHELIYDNFLADIAKVSMNDETIEKDISSQQDQSLLVRILSYRKTNEKDKKGVLITITNISRQRFVENALVLAQEQLRDTLLDSSERLHRRVTTDHSARLLLLDDDNVDRKRISRMIDSFGDRNFKIESFAEIDEAVDAATKTHIDLCIVDYKLSGGTAKDFTHKIREAGVSAPIILLSGYSESGLDSEFIANDISDFLNKDELSSQLLIRSIDYVLEREEMQEVLMSLKTQ